jgi:hypothetical protein
VSNPNVTNGIKSGFMPVAAGAATLPVFTITVPDTKPIWLYCGQLGHCQKGMAMVINEYVLCPLLSRKNIVTDVLLQECGERQNSRTIQGKCR